MRIYTLENKNEILAILTHTDNMSYREFKRICNEANEEAENDFYVLKDILINNKTEDIVTINVIEENEILNITINYTSLLGITSKEVKECIITYTYTNIDKIEEFKIENNNEGENNE